MAKVWSKDAEREQLQKIAALIEETEPGSYIRLAFAGCVKIAEENIQFDFGTSYPDMIAYKDKELIAAQKRIEELRNKADAAEGRANLQKDRAEGAIKKMDQMQTFIEKNFGELNEQIIEWKNKYSYAVNDYERCLKEMQDKLNAKTSSEELEIMRLKAEIYDLMKGEK